MPPRPGALDGFPTIATWSWYEALGVYLLAFVLAGLATLPFIQLMEPEADFTNIVLTVVAALVIIGVLVLWLSRYHRGWLEVLRLFLREDANVLTLEDPNQNVRGTEAAPPSREGRALGPRLAGRACATRSRG